MDDDKLDGLKGSQRRVAEGPVENLLPAPHASFVGGWRRAAVLCAGVSVGFVVFAAPPVVEGAGGLAAQTVAAASAIVMVVLFFYRPIWAPRSALEIGPDHFTLPNPIIISFDGGSTWELAGFAPRRRFTRAEISRVGFHEAQHNSGSQHRSFKKWFLTRPDISFLLIRYDPGILEKSICIAKSSLGPGGLEQILEWSRNCGIVVDEV